MNATITQDFVKAHWKDMLQKQSAQGQPFPGTGPSPDDQTMAKAFMDQAYTHVANKAGRLMEDAYRLGFEIVKKNEATSKILAIFAFRVGRELLYVPTFFLNGMIRGTDLLHRYTPKRFVPLNPDWAGYLIDQATNEQGASVPRAEMSRIRDNVRMDRIVWPPMQTKFASADIPDGGWEQWIDEVCAQPTDIPLLAPEFMAKSAAAYQGLITEIEKSPAVADLLLRHFPEEHFFPEPKFEAEKKASAPAVALKVHLTAQDGIEKAASAGFFDRGYWIEDNRDQEKLAKVALPILEGLVTVGQPGTYDVLTSDGRMVRSLVGIQEEIPRDVTASRDCGVPVPMAGCSMGYAEQSDAAKVPAMRVLALDGSSLTNSDAGFMIYAQDVVDADNPGIDPKDMKVGSLYCLVFPGGGLSREFLVRKAESGNGGMKLFTISEYGWDGQGRALNYNPDADDELCRRAGVINGSYQAVKLSVKPEKPGANEPCCGGSGEFDSVNWTVPTENLGNPATVDAWLFGQMPLKKASVIHDPVEDLYQIRIQPGGNVLTPHEVARELVKQASLDPDLYSLLAEDDRISGWEPRREIATKLAVCLKVPAVDAEAWLDAAVKSASAEHRILEYPEMEKRADAADTLKAIATVMGVTGLGAGAGGLIGNAIDPALTSPGAMLGMTGTIPLAQYLATRGHSKREREKRANMLPIQNNPPYELQGDPIHGIPVEFGPQIHNLESQWGNPPDVRMQLGEVRDAAGGVTNQDGDDSDFIFHMPPDQLAQMAVLQKMPHVLDHGVVGSLAQTYDASAVMDPILNDMERGLDGMGRAIFLLLWKPADFRSMYGADDMPDLENKLTSIFKGLGEVLLDLLKKNRGNSNGSPPVI